MKQNNLFYNHLFILFVLISVFIQTQNLFEEHRTIVGSFYEQFYGLSTISFNLYNYLFVTITFLLPVVIFFINYFVVSKSDIYYQLIRYTSFKQWFYQLLSRMLFHSFLTILIIFFYTFFLAIVFGLSFTGNYPFSYYEIFYQFIVNGFLQLVNYHLILFILFCLTKKTEFILLSVGVLIVLGLPLFNSHWLFPIALNSLGYITGEFYQLIHITFILGFYFILELLVINLLLRKKVIS